MAQAKGPLCAVVVAAMTRRVTDEGIHVERPDLRKLRSGEEVFYWSESNKSWSHTTFLRVSREKADVVRLEVQRSAHAKNVYVAMKKGLSSSLWRSSESPL